jgi:hypothetical protein
MHEKPLPLDNSLIFYNNALYGIYNNIVYRLFPDLPNAEAEPSNTLVPVVRLLTPNNSLIRTAYKDLLSRAIKALYYQVTNITNKLYTKQGPDLSKAFFSTLSALYKLPTEDFALLYTGIYYTSTSFYPNTPSASDIGSPLADSSKEGRTRKLVKGI